MTEAEDRATIDRALERAAGMEDDTPVLDILAGNLVTVTLKLHQWAGIRVALEKLLESADQIGGSPLMRRDVAGYLASINEQASRQMHNSGTSSRVIAQRLREAGFAE